MYAPFLSRRVPRIEINSLRNIFEYLFGSRSLKLYYTLFLSDLSLNLFGCYTFLDIFRFITLFSFQGTHAR